MSDKKIEELVGRVKRGEEPLIDHETVRAELLAEAPMKTFDAEAVAEEINDAMSNWMASKDDKRTGLQVIAATIRPHLSKAAELRAAMGAGEDGWRPIETAPKDGRSVLVVSSHGHYVAMWADDWWHVDDNKHGPFPLRGASPTHWMTLPAAPNERSGE